MRNLEESIRPSAQHTQPRNRIGDQEFFEILFCFIIGFSTFSYLTVKMRTNPARRRWPLFFVVVFFLAHYVFIITHRARSIGWPAVYEGLWVCSISLPLSSLGILTQKHGLIAAALVSIATGHVIWALDTAIMTTNGDLMRSEVTN